MASQAELAQIRRALSELSRAAAGDMQQVWDSLKTTDRMAVSKALENGWTWVLEKYGAPASQLAADFFEVEAGRLNLRSRLVIAPPVDGDRATARLNWALSTADQWGNTQVLLDELVKQPYRSTFQNSAHASGAGWARVPAGSHTCNWCLMLASRGGVYHSKQLAQFGTNGKKYHGECVVEGTLVHGPAAQVALRREYEGEVVSITSTAGHHLTVTPNHPVLTRRGWVAAGALHEGDQLLSALPGQGHVGGRPYEDDAPARVEDRFRALGVVLTAARGRVPGAPEQFHGDGSYAEVDVVALHGFLRDEMQASSLQFGAETQFASGSANEASHCVPLDRLGADEVLARVPRRSPDGSMGGGGLRGPLLRTHLGGPRAASGGPSADLHPGGEQCSPHWTTGDAQGPGDGQLALSGEVSIDDPFGEIQRTRPVRVDPITAVARSFYSGHVFNLTTRNGWYFANSIVTHNCDCQPVLVRSPDDYPEGYDPGGLYEQYLQARRDAGSGDPKQIVAAMRERFGGN